MAFPKHWPKNCPPHESEDAEGLVYRIVKNQPVKHEDFLTHDETGRLPKADACLRCGLSVFRLLADAVLQQQLFPKLGDKIGVAHLDPTQGKTRLTPAQQASHCTWWPYENVDRAALFEVIVEEI